MRLHAALDHHPDLRQTPSRRPRRRVVPKNKGPRTTLQKSQQQVTRGRKNHEGGMEGGCGFECRLYDMRHTFATRFALAGGSLPVLAKILGHADLSLLMRYVHPSQSDMDRAMEWYNAGKTDGPQLEQMLLTGTDCGGKIPEVVRPLCGPPSVQKVVQTEQFGDKSRGRKK